MKTIGVRELTERINEILRLVEEGETIALTDHDEIIAHVVPAIHRKRISKKIVPHGRI